MNHYLVIIRAECIFQLNKMDVHEDLHATIRSRFA